MSCQAFLPVPDAYLGVWSRSLLSTTGGYEDRTTHVRWLQTKTLFADIRIPSPAPAASATTLATASSADLLSLAEQDGFAGVTEAVGNKVTWHREFNVRPESFADVDCGLMTFADPEHVREDGLDGSYLEEWERLPESVGPTWGFRLSDSASSRKGMFVGAGDCFIFVADRREPATVNASNDKLTDAERQAILECEISFGRISGGSSPWHIQDSTLPGRVGSALLGHETTVKDLWELYKAGKKLDAGVIAPAQGWQINEARQD